MDDWVVLAPTRWKLRKAIKAVNEVMAELRVVKHPDKTFIGRIAKGFDFLGYWFTPTGLGVASKTVSLMQDKVFQLYEQGADDERIETYLKRWWQWVRSGVDGVLCAGVPLVGVWLVPLGGALAPYKSGDRTDFFLDKACSIDSNRCSALVGLDNKYSVSCQELNSSKDIKTAFFP